MLAPRLRGRRRAALALLLALAASCDAVEAVRPHHPITDPALLFMGVTLDHRAINLSTAPPHNAIQLDVTARNALGEALVGYPPAVYRSTDSISVRVGADGLVEAREAATGVLVIAEITAEGNVRHADTAVVNVTSNPSPPVLTTFSIEPVPAGSADWSAPAGQFSRLLAQFAGVWTPEGVSVAALDEHGDPIPDLAIDIRSLDTTVVRFEDTPGAAPETVRPGEAAIVATTTAYGVSMTDTLLVTVKMPQFQDVVANKEDGTGRRVWQPVEVRVRTNGVVFWGNVSEEPMTVTFDDPANVEEFTEICQALGPVFGADALCGSGNVDAIANAEGLALGMGSAIRRFPVAGVYTYRSTTTGAVGRVVVSDDLPADP